MARPRKASAQLGSIEDVNQAMRALLLAQVELEKQQGGMDLARAAATAKFEQPLDECKARIADLELQLQTWYMANHAELEKHGSKSAKFLFGVLGRRIGNPALKPLNRSWTWEAIAVKIRSIYNARFFRAVEPELDRNLVRAELTPEQLAAVGLKVEQEERFYVETDRTALGTEG